MLMAPTSPKNILRSLLPIVWVALVATCGGCLFVSASLAAPTPKSEMRCGWFDNPSPGNAWLHDHDGEWTIAIQGNYEAEGDWPEFKDAQWIRTNGSHGYGCTCMKAVVDANTRQVVRIVSAKAQSLGTCRKDRSLKKPVG